MIKLEVEIKNEEFCYRYDVGDTNHSGTIPLGPELLALFTDLVRACSQAYQYKDKQWEKELMAKAYLERMKNTPTGGQGHE